MSKDTALLVIDVQVGVVDWAGLGKQGEEVLSNINNLLSHARACGVPVIYIQHDSGSGGRLEAGTNAWHIHPSIAPAEGELVIGKRASDSFHETALKRELDQRGIKHLVVTGCRTQYCVDTTCRAATSHGYNVTLAADAHMTMSNEILTGTQIIAHHNETLEEFGNDNHLIRVKPSSEIKFGPGG
jgi:nicotinamidase-related amidase